jgi:hypothetical protein
VGAASGSGSSGGSSGGSEEVLGTGRVWWNEVGVAESGSSPEAAALREAWRTAARRRLLLPHCWQLALGLAQGAQQQGPLEELAACYGTQLAQVQQHLRQQLAAQQQLPPSKLARLLPLALLATGHSVQRALSGDAAAAEQAGQLAGAAAELIAAVEAGLVGELRKAGTPSGLLASGGWTAALPVVSEDALLVQHLAERAQQHGRAAKKKKGKKAGDDAAAGEGAAAAAAAAAQAVAALGGAMHALAGAVKQAAAEALGGAPKQEQGAQLLLQAAGELELAPGVQAAAALWGWEDKLDAAAEVKQLLAGQHATLRALQALAAKRGSAIAAALVGLS